ncbi:MAG: erythromycin esterase family protein [Planctomycetes bacterium]|nr:erythromycin esterase family protein [Planctomycetota bacterium]
MTPIDPILPYLCLFLALCGSASAQVSALKPAGFLPAAAQWIGEHASDWERGTFLLEHLRGAKSVVFVLPPQAGAGSLAATRCFETLLAREEPPCLGFATSWGDAYALDRWLGKGEGQLQGLLDKAGLAGFAPQQSAVLALARAWNADEKHTPKLRAVGLDYRVTPDQAIGLAEFIARVDAQLDQRAGQLLAPFRQLGADGKNRYSAVDDNWRFAVRQLLSDFAESVPERREEWAKAVGTEALAAGLRNLQRIRQAEAEYSKPAEFRRGAALLANAAAAREELDCKAGIAVLLPADMELDAEEAHKALGEGTLVVLVLTQAESRENPDFVALTGVRASGALDLRELPKEGQLANWFSLHLGKRADVVLWAGAR